MVKYKRGAVIVDLSIITNNIRAIKSIVHKNTGLMAIVKANAYGHGMQAVAKACQKAEAPADYLGVATTEEALQLRNYGIMLPILIMGAVFCDDYEDLVKNNISLTIFNLKDAKILSNISKKLCKTAKIHIKIDTGMSRIGYSAWEEDLQSSLSEIEEIYKLPNIYVEGIFSHLASSESNPRFSYEQYGRLKHILKEITKIGLHIDIIHISNSGALLNYRNFDNNLVRAGVLLYGMSPHSTAFEAQKLKGYNIKPALTLKSHVTQVKPLRKGRSVGYGQNFIAKQDIVVATIPLGYGDGISRQLSNSGKVLINGEFANIIGNVCMDQFMVDISHIKNVTQNSEVTLIGGCGKNTISSEDIAKWQNTINYEVLTCLMARLPRVYINSQGLI